MTIIWKNRGILVPVYVSVSTITPFLILEILREYLNIILFDNVDIKIIFSVGLFISGIWTYLTSEDFIKVEGKKMKVDILNSFFYIPMKIWGYILSFLGICIFIFLII